MSGTKRTKDDVQKEKKNDRTKRGKEKDEEVFKHFNLP